MAGRSDFLCCTIGKRASVKLLPLAAAGFVASVAANPPPFSAGLPAAGEPGSVAAADPGWESVTIRGREPAQFSIDEIDGERVLLAEADASGGGMGYRLNDASQDTGSISWRWRINNHIAGSDITARQGDDFPARVYLTFARDPGSLPFAIRMKRRLARLFFGQEIPTAALCYVWAESLPVDTIAPNAYSDTVMMWVLENGGPTPSEWRSETRDYRADYREAFGTAAPALTGIILAIDTDDTGATARTWFGDVSLAAVRSTAN